MHEKKNYNLVFISTFIDRENIENLINSTILNNQDLTILFIIINQTKNSLELPTSSLIDFHQVNTDRLSLSKARNIGIAYILRNNLTFDHIMFPDDDSTFSNLFFSRYKEYIKKGVNYLIDVYCFGTDELFKPTNFKNESILNRENHSSAMSVNMIIDFDTFKLVGLFDERLGVGAQYGSGEDGDYFIRSCDITGKGFMYQKMMFNFHPSSSNKFSQMSLSQTINTYIAYGDGAIFVLCKHKMYKMAFMICFYALGGAVLSLFRLNFKLFAAYGIAYFSRLSMFLQCFLNTKKYISNDKMDCQTT